MRLAAVIMTVALASFGVTARVVLTAASDVPTSSAGYYTSVKGPNDVKPSSCTNIVTAIVEGSGTFSGTASSELILGSAGADTITGGGGSDCIYGGAGNDSLTGGTSADVLVGGADTDVCTGGTGADTFIECETTNP